MKVGLYYHLGAILDGERVALPSHLAIFVEELARQAGKVVYFGHSDSPEQLDDHILGPPLVDAVDLGPRRSYPARTFWPRRAIRRFVRSSQDLDVMLVRGPTPLLPHLVKASVSPVSLLLGGDFSGGAPNSAFPQWKRAAISAWVRFYSAQQRRAGRRALVLTNSPALTLSADSRWPKVVEVFTSSLSGRDLERSYQPRSWPPGKGKSHPVRLLFAGRISEEKGLLTAVDALAILKSRGWDVVLELVGWIDEPNFKTFLEDRAGQRGVRERLRFGTYKPAGPELLAVYQDCDIFVMPSLAEGFPRAIVEALAVGRPVVASRVGGIPKRLGEDVAILIEPNNPPQLADAIECLITDEERRDAQVRAGHRLAQSQTNERSCALIARCLEEWSRSAPLAQRDRLGRLRQVMTPRSHNARM